MMRRMVRGVPATAMGRWGSATAGRACATNGTAVAAAQDTIKVFLREDDAKVLWGPRQASPLSTERGVVERLLSCGWDPVLDADTFNQDPFSDIPNEDAFGTNLWNGQNVAGSQAFWEDYFLKRHSSAMRLARNPDIGNINAAAHPLRDTADDPKAKWSDDADFKKLQFKFKKAGLTVPMTLQQAEQVLRAAGPKEFTNLCLRLDRSQDHAFAFPTSAFWHYEDPALSQWVDRYKPEQHARDAFVKTHRDVLAKQWPAVMKAYGSVMEQVVDIVIKRRARQVEAGIVKAWDKCTEAEKLSQAEHETAIVGSSILDGRYDSEDTRDSSEEFIAENDTISKLMAADLPGFGFSAESLWKHLVRCESLEFEHLYTAPVHCHRAALSRARLYDEVGYAQVTRDLLQSVVKSSFDVDAATITPFMNDTWLKSNWFMFGSGTAAVHSVTAQRLLQFHYRHLDAVKALATGFYSLRPLGSKINYASPYEHRRSVAKVCSRVSAELQADFTKDYISLGYHTKAIVEKTSAYVRHVSRAVGASRRKAAADVRTRNTQRLGGAVSVQLKRTGDGADLKTTSPGRRIRIDFSAKTGDQKVDTSSLSVELSLWRKRGASDAAPAKVGFFEANAETDATLAKLFAAAYPDVAKYVDAAILPADFDKTAAGAALKTEDGDQWEFVTMLHDMAPLAGRGEATVTIPYYPLSVGGTWDTAKPLPAGTYRVQARTLDSETNPTSSLALSPIAQSPDFVMDGGLAQEIQAHCGTDETAFFLKGEDVQILLSHLRDQGFFASLEQEFEIGQRCNPEGEIHIDDVKEVLMAPSRDLKVDRMLPAAGGFSDPQLAAEGDIVRVWAQRCPGATKYEWWSARRYELNRAFGEERGWWTPDPGMLRPEANPMNTLDAGMQYSHDRVLCLSAEGRSAEGASVTPVHATYEAAGYLSSLRIDPDHTQPNATLKDVLSGVQSALDASHRALNTLAHHHQHRIQAAAFIQQTCEANTTASGGKFARTHLHAYETALADLSPASVAALAREKPVDRYASQDNHEMRRKLFQHTQGPSKENVDDMPAEFDKPHWH